MVFCQSSIFLFSMYYFVLFARCRNVGPGGSLFFAPNAHVHGPRVSWKNGRQIKILNTRIIWTTVSILKKTEFDFMSCNNFYSPTNIAYFSQKRYFFAKSRKSTHFVQGHITLCVCKHIWRTIPFLNRPRDLLLIQNTFMERRKVYIFRRYVRRQQVQRDLQTKDQRTTYLRAHNRSNSYCST